MKNSNDTVGKRTLDLPACSAVPELDSKLQSKISFFILTEFFHSPFFQFRISQFEGMNVFSDFAVRVGRGITFLHKKKNLKAEPQCKIKNKKNITCLTPQVFCVSPINNYVSIQSIQANVFAFVFSYLQRYNTIGISGHHSQALMKG